MTIFIPPPKVRDVKKKLTAGEAGVEHARSAKQAGHVSSRPDVRHAHATARCEHGTRRVMPAEAGIQTEARVTRGVPRCRGSRRVVVADAEPALAGFLPPQE